MVGRLLQQRAGRLVSLGSADDLTAAEQDPDGFVRQFPAGLLGTDEAQRVPALIRALKAAVDEDRRPGRFLITGFADLGEPIAITWKLDQPLPHDFFAAASVAS